MSVNKSLLSDENQEKCLKNMCEAVRNDINLANRTMLELRVNREGILNKSLESVLHTSCEGKKIFKGGGKAIFMESYT